MQTARRPLLLTKSVCECGCRPAYALVRSNTVVQQGTERDGCKPQEVLRTTNGPARLTGPPPPASRIRRVL
jgi:hypothetical protein